MRKLTKYQRWQQRRVRKKAKDERKPATKHPRPWVAPKMRLFKLPPLFRENVPWEQRLDLVRTMGVKAAQEFDDKYPNIQKWFARYDALYLLSYCATYFLSHPEGVDPEATGKPDFYYHYLEIMQAFALTEPRTCTARPLFQEGMVLKREMQDIGSAMSMRLLNIPPEVASEADLHAYHLRTEMMEQTAAIRNWAYFHQIQRTIRALAEAVRKEFKVRYGVDPVEFMQLLFALTEKRNDLLNAHRRKVQSFFKKRHHKTIIEAYDAAFPENSPIAPAHVDEVWNYVRTKRGALLALLIAHSDLKLMEVFSFTLEQAHPLLKTEVPPDALERLFDRLAYNFGDLKDFNKKHIVLGREHSFFVTHCRAAGGAVQASLASSFQRRAL